MQDAILIGVIVVPIIALLAMKSHAAIVLLSLCAGSLLVQYAGNEASLAITSFSPTNRVALDSATRLTLLLAPALVGAITLRGSMSGSKAVGNMLPAIGVGLMGTLLAVPLLPENVKSSVKQYPMWADLVSFQSVIVATGIVLSLTVLWIGHKPHDPKDKKKKH